MQTWNSTRRLLSSIVALGVLALLPSHAQASQEFPGALQEAAGMPCVPSCVVCHGKTPGDAGSFTARALARGIAAKGLPMAHDVNALKKSFGLYAADPANAQAVKDLQAGIDPETGDGLCGPTYGCGAHVAKHAPPSDFAGPLWALGAVVAGGLLRRRRRPNAR